MKKISQKKFIEKAKRIHGEKYGYSKTKYNGTHNKIIVKCNKHGFFERIAFSFLKGGCPKCSWDKMGFDKKMTQNEFLKKAKKIHGNKYNYKLSKYNGYYSKIKIVCNTCKEIFVQVAGQHLTGIKCKKCHPVKIDTTEFLKRAKHIHQNKFNYKNVKITGVRNKIKIICNKCKTQFTTTPSSHLISSRGCCPKCATIETKNRLSLKKKAFIKRANKIHNNKYNYSKIETIFNWNKKLKIFCKFHKKYFQQTAGSHLSGRGCLKCGAIKSSKKQLGDIKALIQKANKIHNNKYNYDKIIYKGIDKPIKISCKKHGVFVTTMNQHIYSKCGCRRCSKKVSLSENKWLKIMNVPNSKKCRQAIIKCNNKIYKVDGYISKTNTVYEFYGDYYHGNPKKYNCSKTNVTTKKTFGELYKRTIERENELKSAGYNLITIWESDFKNNLKQFNY